MAYLLATENCQVAYVSEDRLQTTGIIYIVYALNNVGDILVLIVYDPRKGLNLNI